MKFVKISIIAAALAGFVLSAAEPPETEPSAKAVAEITDAILEDGIPVIYYEELVDPKVARSIAEDTGCAMLLLHSCHNVSKEELDAGATYLSLMRQNLENLKTGLY